MKFPYEDIVHFPHHVSNVHPPMPREERAAQFAPFAALTGHADAISETARLTDMETDLSENNIEELNRFHRILKEHLAEEPLVTFVYFLPDEKKSGGRYVSKTGHVKKVDEYERVYVLTDHSRIPMNHLFSMEGDLFQQEKT